MSFTTESTKDSVFTTEATMSFTTESTKDSVFTTEATKDFVFTTVVHGGTQWFF